METLNFSDLFLLDGIQQAIADMGFTQASPIQAQAIPFLLDGRDVIGQAQTGTGKTAAFAIPALQQTDIKNYAPQTLVLCPTRELAVQVAEEFKKIGKHLKGIHVTAIYGGDSIERQIKTLRRGVHIVIGTPGRVIDHIERGTLDLSEVSRIILDEADEMLNMGFIDDIELVLQQLPAERQTIFFSATMPAPILSLTKKYQNNPHIVKVTAKELTNRTIEQSYFKVRGEYKSALVARLIEVYDLKSAIVFCNTKQKVDELVDELQEIGVAAEAIHGDLRQNQRTMVMGKFKTGKLAVLVATDVAARGIDVDNVEAVINYDVPMDAEYYVHRIGRTGRAGKSGKSFTFATPRDMRKIQEIERYAKVQIPQGQIPTQADVWAYRQIRLADQVKAEIAEGELNHFETIFNNLLNEGFDAQTIALALMKKHLGLPKDNTQDDMEFKESKSKSEGRGDRFDRNDRGNRNDRNRESKFSSNKGGSKFSKESQGNMTRIFINAGKNQKVSKSDILGAITGETGIRGSQIGSIDIFDKYSFVDIASIEAQNVLKVMNQRTIKGKKVNFEFADN
jgi:ATP-dependent RNA helicase DeaD